MENERDWDRKKFLLSIYSSAFHFLLSSLQISNKSIPVCDGIRHLRPFHTITLKSFWVVIRYLKNMLIAIAWTLIWGKWGSHFDNVPRFCIFTITLQVLELTPAVQTVLELRPYSSNTPLRVHPTCPFSQCKCSTFWCHPEADMHMELNCGKQLEKMATRLGTGW